MMRPSMGTRALQSGVYLAGALFDAAPIMWVDIVGKVLLIGLETVDDPGSVIRTSSVVAVPCP